MCVCSWVTDAVESFNFSATDKATQMQFIYFNSMSVQKNTFYFVLCRRRDLEVWYFLKEMNLQWTYNRSAIPFSQLWEYNVIIDDLFTQMTINSYP